MRYWQHLGNVFCKGKDGAKVDAAHAEFLMWPGAVLHSMAPSGAASQLASLEHAWPLRCHA